MGMRCRLRCFGRRASGVRTLSFGKVAKACWAMGSEQVNGVGDSAYVFRLAGARAVLGDIRA